MLEIRLLGGFDVRLDGKNITIPSRPAQSLFAYPVLNPKTAHRREKLAGLLWPDSAEENARDYLRHALWRIRKSFLAKDKADLLVADDMAITIGGSHRYWLDTEVIESVSENAPAEELLTALVAYRGELLPGFYDEWIVLEREHLQAVFEHKMARLMALLQQDGRWLDVLEWGERWISLGQKPEPAFRAVMSAHAALGEMSKVAATYERCVNSLREFGIEPSEQTKVLYERLKSGQANLQQESTRPVEQQRESRLETNLPVPITSFIGREKEVGELVELIGRHRLITLTGSGGVGKTRLAVQSSNRLVSKFKDGIWWVDLAPLTNAALVSQAIAEALGLRESPNQSLSESLKGYLRQKQLLLVLDNCEHLITACAQLADDLLTHCGGLRVLATSREALGIMGEVVYQVPTLSLPKPERLTIIDLLLEYEGIRLFVERASAVKSDFALTEQNASAVLQICRRLDGIPLALELAAARTKLLSAEHIAEHINDRFSLLTQGSRTALPRQQTLRATIDWSYDLLPELARTLFQRLSVFVGGFTLEAAEGICSGGLLTPSILLDQLTLLVDRSLVKAERQEDNVRYRMLETIREYAREKLDEAGEIDLLLRRHGAFFVAFAEQAEPKLKTSAQFEWLDRLEVEHDNLRAAWDCVIDNDVESAQRLASAFLDFWSIRGNPSEVRQWLAELLPRTIEWGQTTKRAHVLSVAGRLAYLLRDFRTARRMLEEALGIARTTNDQNEIAFTLLWLGWTAHRQHDDQAAQAYLEECLTLYQALKDQWATAMIIYQLAAVAGAQGRYEEAEERYMESLARFQRLGDKFRAGYVLNGLGELARIVGNYEQAKEVLRGTHRNFTSPSQPCRSGNFFS